MLSILSAYAMVAPGFPILADHSELGDFVHQYSPDFQELETNLRQYATDEIVSCITEMESSETCHEIGALFREKNSVRSFIAKNWETIEHKIEQQDQDAPLKGNTVDWKNVLTALKQNSDPFSIKTQCPVEKHALIKRTGKVKCARFLTAMSLGSHLALLISAAMGKMSGHTAIIIVICLSSMSVVIQSVELVLNCCGQTLRKYGQIEDKKRRRFSLGFNK